MNRLTSLLLLAFLSLECFSQSPGFSQFTIDNNLPSNTVYDIDQDENGFIWIATDYGLGKFDGLKFTNFTIADGLPDNEILSLFKDSKNRIWLICFNGKIGYIKNNQFYNSKNQPFLKELEFKGFVSDIFEDSSHNIWFFESLTQIKKVDYSFNISTFKIENLSKKYPSQQLKLIEDKNKNVQIVNSITDEKNLNNVTISSLENPKWENINLDLFSELSLKILRSKKTEALKDFDPISSKISETIVDYFKYDKKNNTLYRNTSIGHKSYLITNLQEGALLIHPEEDTQNSIKILPSIKTTNAFVDNENNIWIGSQSNGIFLFPNIQANGIQFSNPKKNDVHSVHLFNKKIVIGNNLSEVIVLNNKSLKEEYSFNLDKTSQRIRHLKNYKNSLYVLSDQNIHRLNSTFELERIQNMYGYNYKKTNLKNFKDVSFLDNFIYTANSNGTSEINSVSCDVKKLWNKRSTAILCLNKDSIWIGSIDGLYLKNSRNTTKYKLNEQFNSSIIYALKKSKYGLLIGSNSYGLGVLKNETFKTISINDGLLSNYIKSIFVDASNNIWVSTNFGLNCVTLNDNNEVVKIKTYTTSDGLYSNDVRDCVVDELTNKVYVATSKGLNIIDLSKELTSILTPTVHINEILINNKPIVKTSDQHFKFNSNNIQFSFSGISFKSLGNISFKYRLKGLEPEYIETKNNTVRYSSLPPNSYTFELKAVSKNNIENKNPITYSFTIVPPYYKKWWFKGLFTLINLALISYLFYRKNKRLKKERLNNEKISALRYRALNAQMNPHFINNLVVNINDLANKGELTNVKDSLAKFAKLVNLVLQSTKSNLIPLKDEIKMCKLYLDLQKLRFNKNLQYKISKNAITSDEFDTILVPPMILQPIIENAIKHGFKNGRDSNKIAINFKIENNEFIICEIIDNGSGINQNNAVTNDSGISLENINTRLQLISEASKKEKFVFTSNLTNEFNTLAGTKVTLKIPLISF